MSSIIPPSPEVENFAAWRDCLRIHWTTDGVTVELAGPAVDELESELRAELLEAAGDVLFLGLAERGIPVTAIEIGGGA